MSNPLLAYIFKGQLRLERDGGGEILESEFGRTLRDRAFQIHNRHAWKERGRGGRSLSAALRMPAECAPDDFRIEITSVTRGLNSGELLYTLETDEISGLFARDAEGVESRLFHTADFRLRHLNQHPNGSEVAVSIYYPNGMVNLAVLNRNGSGLTEVTDGESVDVAPRWVPGPNRRLVFQSAGLARGSGARFSGHSAFAVQQLDLDTAEISCLAQDPNFDFLWPQIAADGALYFIRRPNANAPQPVDPLAALHQTVALPFRILWVIGKLIDLFAERRTGRPVFTSNEASEKAVKTPASWLLMRQAPSADQPETLAEGALSFDLADDGSVIYSNGFDVFRLHANGAPAAKLLSGANIDIIAAL